MAFGLTPDPDETSAPPIDIPQTQELQSAASPMKSILAQRKKRGPRPAQGLASAIARSKRARPMTYKFGN